MQLLPRERWNETVEQYTTRLKGIVQHINDNHDIESLCKEFPDRMAEVARREGDKINKRFQDNVQAVFVKKLAPLAGRGGGATQ